MSTHNLQLLDFPGNYEKGTLQYGPRACIGVKTSSTIRWAEVDFNIISADCLSFSEFEHEIDIIIEELVTIKIHAKKFFQKEAIKRSINRKL